MGCSVRARLERGRFERVPGQGQKGLVVPFAREVDTEGSELIRDRGIKQGPAALGAGAATRFGPLSGVAMEAAGKGQGGDTGGR